MMEMIDTNVEMVERLTRRRVQTGEPWDCWPWLGKADQPTKYVGRDDQGRMMFRNLSIIVFEKSRGRPVGEGLFVMHICDNGRCMNPCHLVEGTHHDNMLDMTRKGRQAMGNKNGSRTHPERVPRGENHWMRRHPELVTGGDKHLPKLTDEDIAEIIRIRVEEGLSYARIGAKFGVCADTVGYHVRKYLGDT